MTGAVELRVLELLAARLCHDLIGPVGAIANGAELLGQEDPGFVGEAAALIGQSARTAGRRLQFYRFAYGFAGGGLTGPPPHQLAAEFFADSAIECAYGSAARDLPLYRQKLACAMLATAGEGLRRGGRLLLEVGAAGPEVDAIGEGSGVAPEARAALTLASPVRDLTARTVGAYVTGLLAAAQGQRLAIADRPGAFRVVAVPG